MITDDAAFRVAQVGDDVPDRQLPPPVGTGSSWTGFDSFSVSLSERYVAFRGQGDFFDGAYTYRFSDGARFAVAENFIVAPTFGTIFGLQFHGDSDVIFGADTGIYRGDAEGATAAEVILENGTEYQPGKFFNSDPERSRWDDRQRPS